MCTGTVGGLAFPYIKKTKITAGVLNSNTGVGFCFAYDSNNQSNFCLVAFGKKHSVDIKVQKLAGNLEVGSVYNNIGTWNCPGADTYVLIAI